MILGGMSPRKSEGLFLPFIFMLGFALRLHTLGRDSFWLDEAGQAMAVLQPSLAGMFTIERTHAMAMPLDYLVARLFNDQFPHEFFLRIPAVMWGTLALPLIAKVAGHLCDRDTAILAAFLMAISPIFIRYSQELRFYSALVTVFLICLAALLQALVQPSRRNWVILTLVTTIGSYFHPYILLSFLNGVLYCVFPGSPKTGGKKILIPLLLAGLVAILLFIPGYLIFGAHQDYAFELMQWGGTVSQVIRLGLDWTGLAAGSQTVVVQFFLILNTVFIIVGLYSAFKHWPRYALLLSMVIGTILSIGAIIIASQIKGYWFLSRQLLHLAPVCIILFSFGITSTTRRLSQISAIKDQGTLNRFAFALTAAIVILAFIVMVAPLTSYYTQPKSLAREVSEEVEDAFREGNIILIIPSFDRQIYEFYLETGGNLSVKAENLIPGDWATLVDDVASKHKPDYIVIRGSLTTEQAEQLNLLGYTHYRGPWSARDGSYNIMKRDPH